MSDANLLQECGVALHGSRWHTDLARDLDVTDRTVRRWETGYSPIPSGAWVDLRRLIVERGEALRGLAKRLP